MTPWLFPSVIAHVELYLASYRRLVGVELLPCTASLSGEERARLLFTAPFVAVSHGTEADPLFNYGNRTALALWEMPWEELVGLPSRYSAEADHRAERERLLQSVAERGYATDYAGIRASKNGRRFRIEQATVWNLVDERGIRHGQGATFARWTFL